MSKLKSILLVAGAVFIVILLVMLKKRNEEIGDLKDELEKNNDLTRESRERIRLLLDSDLNIDPAIAGELKQIVELLELKHDTKAILSLAKIIENLLKQLYSNDPEILKLKNPDFHNYLELGKKKGVFSKEDFHYLSILRLIRNEEAHELDVQKEQKKLDGAFAAGISCIVSLSKMVKQNILPATESGIGGV